jgi:NitT/TauT family transport system substrate-binding protein
VKGKAVATGGFGGTPNSITRYLLKKWNLDAKSDVTVVETANSAILAAVKGKRAQLGCSTEPYITQGVRQGIWDEPFFNVPKELGPYAYSTINIRLDSIKKEPEVVRGFVRGMMWSKDGMVSRAAWDTAKAVVMDAGILKSDVKYDEIIDMSFVESVKASL